MIIPLGRLISLGYRVDWKKEGFKLKDLPPEKQGGFPCYFEFPEWKSVESLIDLKLLNFDQERLGHIRQKPTTLATNMKPLNYLDELRVDHTFERKPLPEDLKQRIAESSGWSAWGLGTWSQKGYR